MPRARRPRPAAPGARAALDGLQVARTTPPDGAVSRWFYVAAAVTTRGPTASTGPGRLAGWAERVQTWAATVERHPAGYFELRPDAASVEVEFLGLLAPYQGRGLGGYLVTVPWAAR